MRILLTTDNHVGYNETDPLRGGDSARTFDEIMEIAQEKDVDFVLQGGDLFHINKPSKQSLYDVIKTLRKRCLGDKPIEFELLHHGQLSLDSGLDHANFQDPDINVSIPVFAISGNHDDRGGTVLLSPLDVLSATGLINYFGRVLDNDDIQVTPLLFRKGSVKVAVYGLSNVRDERLHRAFRNGNVKFLTTPDQDTYFNILIVHQNRTAHTETNYLPETFIPNFFQMVIWGHEHDCRIDPEINPSTGFEVLQPGSSVATSLSEGETIPKCIGILDIKSNKSYNLEKIPLKTVRPFKMETVSVQKDSDIKPSKDAEKQISTWMRKHVDSLINEANTEWQSSNPDSPPPLPLIRLRVDYSGGYEVENPTRFSNKFNDRVANPNDLVQYTKRRDTQAAKSKVGIDFSIDSVSDEKVQLSELVHQFLEKQTLQVIPEKGMTGAISQFVDRDDKTALKEFVDLTLRTNVEVVTKESSHSSVGVRSAPVVNPAGDGDELSRGTIPAGDVTVDTDDGDFQEDLEIAKAQVHSARKQQPVPIEIDSDSPVEEEMQRPPKPVAMPAQASISKPKAKPRATAKPEQKTPAKAVPKPRQEIFVATPLEDRMDSDDGFD